MPTRILVFILLAIGISYAQSSTRHYNLEDGLAIEGYDPVAYFTMGKALKGDPKIVAKVNGVRYNFMTEAHKALFVKNPQKYQPQYGGWCAYAMGATDNFVTVDPETFKIINGKLYLYFHNWVNNTLLKWNKDEANYLRKADKNWAEKNKN